MLHRAGQIELPGIRFRPPNPLARRERPRPMLIDMTHLDAPLSAIRPILLQQVRKTTDELLFNSRWNSITILAISSRWANT